MIFVEVFIVIMKTQILKLLIERTNLFKLYGTDVYSLYDKNTNNKFDADICPNCTERIQDTINNILKEHIEI